MLALDKMNAWLNRMFRNLLVHFIFWYGSLLFYVFLTGNDNFLKSHLNFFQSPDLYVIILVLSGAIALFFSLVEGILSLRFMFFFPRALLIIFRSILYFSSVFIFLLIAAEIPIRQFLREDFVMLLNHLPEPDIHLIRFLIYFYFSGFLLNFIKGMLRKVGNRNFRNWILGTLNKPMEQDRIFMFIDMKSSTSLAETLNHKKFSKLIQDVFNDMEVVNNYQGEIYQYLGDGAIISWPLKEGLRGNNFLRAFYAFKSEVHRRRRYYRRKYNHEPSFKAGAHAGKVMVLQVGRTRREISYNGDTVNTAARIESRCNDLKQEMLISKDLFDLLEMKKGFNFKNGGNLKLDGKKKGVDIYQVRRKA
jgi:adenylate cyclase